MAAVLFDTHEAVKELQDAGVEPAAAEAVVRTVRRGLGENVATKHDIAALDTRITEVKAELKADIAEFKAEMHAEFKNLYRYLWIMGAGIVALNVTLTVTLTKVLS